MASIRNIKKDIVYLTNEVVLDACIFINLYPEKKQDEALAIANKALDLRRDLLHRANHPEGKAKAHYKAVFNDLLAGVDESFRQISALTK